MKIFKRELLILVNWKGLNYYSILHTEQNFFCYSFGSAVHSQFEKKNNNNNLNFFG